MPNPSRKTNFLGANVEGEILVFPVQLTTSRIGNLTRLFHTLAICVTVHACALAATHIKLTIILGPRARFLHQLVRGFNQSINQTSPSFLSSTYVVQE